MVGGSGLDTGCWGGAGRDDVMGVGCEVTDVGCKARGVVCEVRGVVCCFCCSNMSF